jgi:hypothetical protein
MIGAAGGGIVAATIGLVLGVSHSGGSPASVEVIVGPCTDCKAAINVRSLQENVSYGNYLRLIDASTAHVGKSSLSRNGVVIRFRLVTFGKGNFRQSVALIAFDGTIVSVQPTTIVPRARVVEKESVVWVPTPSSAGKYHVRIQIFAPRALTGDAPLAIDTTKAFVGRGRPSARPRVILTVIKAGTGTGVVEAPGISCGQICSGAYAIGTVITLRAVPDRDSVFVGWRARAPCNPRRPVCSVRVGTVTAVGAVFSLIVG